MKQIFPPSGVEHGNLRELALARMKDFGTECRDVRTREVWKLYIDTLQDECFIRQTRFPIILSRLASKRSTTRSDLMRSSW